MEKSKDGQMSCNNKDCSYNIHNKNYFVNHWGYLLCILSVSIISGIFFYSYNKSYNDGIKDIVASHKSFYHSYEFEKEICVTDSIVIYRDIRPVLESHISTITNCIEAQYDKLQNDYTVLTIWASVLMIIFLIFSIYSMFKIDEIQKQSRESLRQIDDIYAKVKNKSDNLDDLVVKAIEKVDKTFNSKIADFSSEIQEKSLEVKSQIENYEKEVAEAAATNQQLYGKLVDILTRGAVSAKAEGSSSKSRNPKKK